jgi:hypothetical protein
MGCLVIEELGMLASNFYRQKYLRTDYRGKHSFHNAEPGFNGVLVFIDQP